VHVHQNPIVCRICDEQYCGKCLVDNDPELPWQICGECWDSKPDENYARDHARYLAMKQARAFISCSDAWLDDFELSLEWYIHISRILNYISDCLRDGRTCKKEFKSIMFGPSTVQITRDAKDRQLVRMDLSQGMIDAEAVLWITILGDESSSNRDGFIALARRQNASFVGWAEQLCMTQFKRALTEPIPRADFDEMSSFPKSSWW